MTRRAPALFLFLFLGFATGGLRAQTVSVTTPLGGDPLIVEGFRGEEGTSRLFSYTLDFAAARGRDVPFDTFLGKDVTVTVTLPNGTVRHFNGIVSRFAAGRLDTRAHYQMEIAPKFWLLTRRVTSRVFEDESVPQIVARILGSIPGLAFDLRLAGVFPERRYVVQHNETDFDFISRLMEDEGIFYFFQHAPGGHVMVVANSPAGAPDLPGMHVFRPGLFLPPPPGSVTAWEKTQEIRSGKVTLRDHTFQVPDEDFEAVATIQESVMAGAVEHHLAAGAEGLEVFDYPGDYAQRFDGIDPGGAERPAELSKIFPESQRVAAIRMQEEAAKALVIHGESTAPDLAPGHLMTLGGVMTQFNGKYLVTGVTHKYTPGSTGSAGYRNTFTCIPAGLPYRPPRITPKPRLPGLETAVVIAPPGEEVFIDKYARVKVKFPWMPKEPVPGGGSSSCWVRVSSPWAGAGAGTGSGPVILPRVGWEVLVAFEGGDPDKPIIVGSVYNADHPPPLER